MPGDRLDGRILEQLFGVIESRRGADPRTSSIRLDCWPRDAPRSPRRPRRCGAALAEGPQELAAESADLLYHLLVLWASAGIKPREVWTQLAKREGLPVWPKRRRRQSDGQGEGQ